MAKGSKRAMPYRRHKPISPKSLANLTPLKKGQNTGRKGNRVGRKPGSSTIVAAIRSKLDDKVRKLFDAAAIKAGRVSLTKRCLDKRLADAIAEMALKQVLKGDLGWFREIVARAEGAVAQTVNLTTSAKAPTPEEAAAAIEASYRAEERERLDATDS
jgi:hypothetical protein